MCWPAEPTNSALPLPLPPCKGKFYPLPRAGEDQSPLPQSQKEGTWLSNRGQLLRPGYIPRPLAHRKTFLLLVVAEVVRTFRGPSAPAPAVPSPAGWPLACWHRPPPGPAEGGGDAPTPGSAKRCSSSRDCGQNQRNCQEEARNTIQTELFEEPKICKMHIPHKSLL